MNGAGLSRGAFAWTQPRSASPAWRESPAELALSWRVDPATRTRPDGAAGDAVTAM
ncbi:MAG: hypothetical protein IBJ03_08915 [Gemmatimonadaceae bacterium]|nr:hypothetical protein [Gemmatimonadaceae bacterium]